MEKLGHWIYGTPFSYPTEKLGAGWFYLNHMVLCWWQGLWQEDIWNFPTRFNVAGFVPVHGARASLVNLWVSHKGNLSMNC